MCTNGKRSGCMRLETASLIIGVINVLLWICGIAAGISLIYFGNGKFAWPWERKKMTVRKQMSLAGVILIIISAVNLIFSVLLCVGAAKKRLSFLAAYVVFGVLQAITVAAGGTVLAITVSSIGYGILTWTLIVIYALQILTVGITRNKLASRELTLSVSGSFF